MRLFALMLIAVTVLIAADLPWDKFAKVSPSWPTRPKEYATMQCSTDEVRVVPLPGSHDVLTDVLRAGAQKLLSQAVEAEVHDWIQQRAGQRDDQGRQQVVRNGYLPERTILSGLGPIAVEQPRVRDRRPAQEREKFSSQILPPYLRKTKSVEELIPWLYLKGISSGDFNEALAALLGPDVKGLSATTVTRLKGIWQEEYQHWRTRSLEGKRYVYAAFFLSAIHNFWL